MASGQSWNLGPLLTYREVLQKSKLYRPWHFVVTKVCTSNVFHLWKPQKRQSGGRLVVTREGERGRGAGDAQGVEGVLGGLKNKVQEKEGAHSSVPQPRAVTRVQTFYIFN